MDKNKAKLAGLKRRQRRVRGKIFGTPERPRLRVVRTNANIYAMIVDDTKGNTLVSASTLEAEFKGTHTSNKEAAEKVGMNAVLYVQGTDLAKVLKNRLEELEQC